MTLEKVINIWRQASDDLKVEIQAPLILKNQDNKEIKFELLIENFGSKKGTIILSTDDMTEFNTPEKYGYYCSALNPVNFETYWSFRAK